MPLLRAPFSIIKPSQFWVVYMNEVVKLQYPIKPVMLGSISYIQKRLVGKCMALNLQVDITATEGS